MLQFMGDTHTYLQDQILSYHRQVDARVLGIILKSIFVIPRIYQPKEIIYDMTDKYKIDVSNTQAWCAKTYVINALQRYVDKSFLLLFDYCHNPKLQNPRTVTHIDTNTENKS